MATSASRSAHLTVIDAIAQRNHVSRCSFGNARTRDCGRAGLWMCALRRFGGDFDDDAGRSRGARAWRELRGTAFRTAPIDNSVDPSAHIVRNVKRAVGSDCEAARTMFGFLRRLHRSRKTVCKYFALAGRAVAGERLKNYVVAALRIWRPIPRTVEGDEYAVTVAGGELFL